MSLKFVGVQHDVEDPTPGDNVTKVKYADVTFSFTGTPTAGQKFQYKVGDAEWTDVTPIGKTIVVPHIDLSRGSEQGGHHEYRMGIMEVIGNTITDVQVRLLNASGSPVASISQPIEYDVTDPTEQLTSPRIVDQEAGGLVTTRETVDVTFDISERDDGIVQWRVKGESAWKTAQIDSKGETAILKDIDLSTTDPTIEVRVIDVAGNIGDTFNFDIDGPAGPTAPAEVSVSLGTQGLMVVSPIAGTIELVTSAGAIQVDSSANDKGAVANGMVEVLEQSAPVQGKLTVVPVLGETLNDAKDRTYTLGTADGDQELAGQYVWGFGGDDKISGTDGNDYLSGGAGNDTIYSNGGSDTISGGAGGDTIILINDPDEAPSTLLYFGHESLTGQFKSGDSLAGIDRIKNAEVGDVIQIDSYYSAAVPIVSDTFLTNASAQGAVSVIRGNEIAGSFAPSVNGSAYMMQWRDLEAVNSILFTNFSAGAMGLKIDGQRMTLVDLPLISTFVGIDFAFSASDSAFTLTGTPHDVVMANTNSGLLVGGSVTLTDVRTGQPAPAYTDVDLGFGVNSYNEVHFAGALGTGLYSLGWTDGTFATDSGSLGAASVLFAGGVDGGVVIDGFRLKSEKTLDGTPVNASADTASMVYRAHDTVTTVLATGRSQDVVLADDGAVHLRYSVIDSKGHDLVLGFGEDDMIQFSGPAVSIINTNSGGSITWVSELDSTGRVQAQHTDEGAVILTDGTIRVSELDVADSATLDTLNTHLDVSQMLAGDSLLILAKDQGGSGGALLHYVDSDGNGSIDANEVQVIAMFADGVPDEQQIELVGLG